MTRHSTRAALVLVAALIGHAVDLAAQSAAVQALGIKWVRDSEEYAALARQVYRVAADSISRTAAERAGRPWAVVLDIDETTLDNSAYQLERAAYGLPYDSQSWAAWVQRRQAAAVPGVVEFIAGVRKAGGRVAWITNRDAPLSEATRANLEALGLWDAGDRLCGQKSPQHTKAERRREVVTGKGDCAWPGMPMRIAAFVGDQMNDFPAPGEMIPQTGTDAAFGRTCFLLPNPMYGGWTTSVTRQGR